MLPDYLCGDQSTTSEICLQYVIWKNYSIVAMVAGSFSICSAFLTVFCLYEVETYVKRIFVWCTGATVMLFTMITVTFVQLIISKASAADARVVVAAVGTIAITAIGIGTMLVVILFFGYRYFSTRQPIRPYRYRNNQESNA